jgi:hypothetical protein
VSSLLFCASQEWAEAVLGHRDACLDIEPDALQLQYVDAVRDHPLYGTCFFHVRKNRFPERMDSYPDHVIIALNSDGLHFLNEVSLTFSSLLSLLLSLSFVARLLTLLPLPPLSLGCRTARRCHRSGTPTSTDGAAAARSSASSSGTRTRRRRTT